jgi:glycosyltransferase involved in cell wall biosynthesis
MKILIESYNNSFQNVSGGVQVKIKKHIEHIKKVGIEVKLFNKWEDKIANYDLLHIFKINIEDYHLMLYAKNIGKPVILSAILPLEKRFNIWFNLMISSVLRIQTGYSIIYKMLRMADVIVAETKGEAVFISKNYKIPIDKIAVIPNGVSFNSISKENDIVNKVLKLNKPYVLQVGRFDKNKNQLNVIRAMKNSDIPVVFIGGADPSEPEYFLKCKEEATDNFYFLGWVDNENPLLASAFLNAQVVVLPSYNEIFGGSLIEGGLAGANLVCSNNIPINGHSLNDCWTKINPRDTKSIKLGIEKEYFKELESGRSELFEKHFSWSKVTEKYYSIYRKILS